MTEITIHLNDRTAEKLMRKTGGEPEKVLLRYAEKEANTPGTPVKRESWIWEEKEKIRDEYLELIYNYLDHADLRELQQIMYKLAEISNSALHKKNELKNYAAAHNDKEIRGEIKNILHKRKIGENLEALERLAIACTQTISWNELMERQGYTYCPYCGEYHVVKKHNNGTYYCSYANKNFSPIQSQRNQWSKLWKAKIR